MAEDAPTPEPTPRPRKRAGRIARPAPDAPAALVAAEEAPPPVAAAVGPGTFDAAKVAEQFDLWKLNGAQGPYYYIGDAGGWVEETRADISKHLKAKGLRHRPDDPGGLSEIDWVLEYARQHRLLDLALPALAGYHAGVYDFVGRRVLVRTSPILIEPEESAAGWPTIRALVWGLLGEEAAWFFLGWLKLGYEALRNGTRDRGQVCIVVGEKGCGKSRLQHQLLTPIFGGRHADPTSHLFGEDRFNSDLAEAEHLLCEDPAVVLKPETKAHFKERLKGLAVNDSYRVSAKFAAAATLAPWWRVSVTLNDDPDTLKMLPTLADSWRDKVLLFHARKTPLPMPTTTPAERKAFRDRIAGELPALLADLTHEGFWAACPQVRGGRFGSLEYADAELARRIGEHTPEGQLLDMLDHALFSAGGGLNHPPEQPWEGSADDLENLLSGEMSPVGVSARRLFKKGGASRMLGRLEEDYPSRVQRNRSSHKRWWSISPPAV